MVRTMSFGAAWSKIRIGARLGMNGVSSTATHVFGFGVVVGQLGYASEVSSVYAGVQNTPALTYTGSGPYFAAAAAGQYSVTRTGTTIVQGSTVTTITTEIAWAPKNLSQIFLDITRSSSTVLTFAWRAPTVADVVRKVTVYDFLRNTEDEAGSLLYCSGSSAAITATVAATAVFDSISVIHLKSVPTMEIGSLGVVRFE